MWVGNWRERVVSLGAPPSDARVLAFIALGERFFFSLVLSLSVSPLLDVSLSVWLQVGGALAVGGGHCGFHAQVQRRWLWANSCSQSPAFNSLALRCSSPHAVNSFVWLDGILEWYGNVFILKQKQRRCLLSVVFFFSNKDVPHDSWNY